MGHVPGRSHRRDGISPGRPWATRRLPRAFFEGTEGQISFEFFGSRLVVGTPDGKRAVDIPGDQQGLGGMLDAFLAFVTSGETPPTTPEEAAGDLAFVLAAYESVRAHGQPVQVEPAFEKR